MVLERAAFRDLPAVTKEELWGQPEPCEGLEPVLVIRGTDFAAARYADLRGLPVRYVRKTNAERKCLEPGEILMETADQPTGRSVLLKRRLFVTSPYPITCSSFSRFLRVDSQRAERGYIFWYFQHLYNSGKMEEHQVQHTGVARFQYTGFAECTQIPLPHRGEQRALARIFGAPDDKIEVNRRTNETLEATARAIFKSWFVDFDPVRTKAAGRQPAGMGAKTAALFPAAFHSSVSGSMPKRLADLGSWADSGHSDGAIAPRRDV